MAERIDAEEVRRKLDAGSDLLLVCAYEDDQRCRLPGLEGVLSLREFRSRHVPKNREFVFI